MVQKVQCDKQLNAAFLLLIISILHVDAFQNNSFPGSQLGTHSKTKKAHEI